jgi:4'-phosphopantetheinyl transferase
MKKIEFVDKERPQFMFPSALMIKETPDSSWPAQSGKLALPDGELHVWCASLDAQPSQLQSFLSLLAPDEIGRAQRFRFQKDRDRFIVARGILRTILGDYLDEHPARLSFSYNAHGKPALKRADANCIIDDAANDIRFNLSHSGGLALYGFTRKREIGVDVEYISPDFTDTKIAGQFFSASEIAALLALPAERRAGEFFNVWTLKEAYIKARGEGLAFPLDGFCVSLIPGSQQAGLNVYGDANETSRWSLRALSPAPGYAAAVAAEGQDWQLRCWRYQG